MPYARPPSQRLLSSDLTSLMMERWHYLVLIAIFALVSTLEFSRVQHVCAQPSSSACHRIPWARSRDTVVHQPALLASPVGYTYFSASLDEPHPIHKLIREGEAKWQSKLDRQSRTMEDAVTEYRRRYHKAPPKGFGLWYVPWVGRLRRRFGGWELTRSANRFKFAQSRKVQLLDEYDSIHQKILPYASLPSAILRQRLKLLQTHPEDWVRERVGTITVASGRVSVSPGWGRMG